MRNSKNGQLVWLVSHGQGAISVRDMCLFFCARMNSTDLTHNKDLNTPSDSGSGSFEVLMLALPLGMDLGPFFKHQQVFQCNVDADAAAADAAT